MKTDFDWVFEEILYRAELDRKELTDPEALDLAVELCGEEADTKRQRIEDLRTMIQERQECYGVRTDDAYLLKFLRARLFIPALAHRLLVRYCNFKEEHPHFWRDIDWVSIRSAGNMFTHVMYDRPDVGRLLVCRFALWDPDSTPIEDVLRCALMSLEIVSLQPKFQLLGGTLLIDCSGFSMRHLKVYTPSVVACITSMFGYALPIRCRAVHVVNVSRFLEKVFPYLMKFSQAESFAKIFHFHGFDMTSLHNSVDPECLPKSYGGKQEEVTFEYWINKIKQYKDEEFDREMSTMGYVNI